MKRHATAIWNGGGKEGNGYLTTQSGVLTKTPYTFLSRFGTEQGTNPEELLAAAHAGCFTMKLSFVLGEAGHVLETLETTAFIHFENGAITLSNLEVKARVPGISQDKLDACTQEAATNCPMSRVLNAKVVVTASLIN